MAHTGPRPSRVATWTDLMEAPEGSFAEIVDGELVVTPRPGPPHTEAASHLAGELYAPFRRGRGGPGGWVLLSEPGIQFGQDVRVPDLAGWREERFARPETGPYVVMPDWLCEVLSPRTAASDRADKTPLYARHGVRHLWLLDPVARSLETYALHDTAWLVLGNYGGEAKVRADPFGAFELDLALVWR